MTWRRDKLPDLVRAMAGRPRHEALRGYVTELLREGFGAPYDEIADQARRASGSRSRCIAISPLPLAAPRPSPPL